VNLNEVYLAVGDPRGHVKADGYTGWCAREDVFGNRWGKLKDLALVFHAFRSFGDTIGAIYEAEEDPVRTNWLTVVASASRSMQVRTPKRFNTLTVNIALKMWDKVTRVDVDPDDEGEEAYEYVINLSFNLEFLREAVVDVDLCTKNQVKHQVKQIPIHACFWFWSTVNFPGLKFQRHYIAEIATPNFVMLANHHHPWPF
jgi:hypothetical protein